jgi:nucleoside 2-deoxyribosyltransferase
MNNYCAVCAQEAGVAAQQVENRADTFKITCPRCGSYTVDQVAGIYAIQHTIGPERALLSGVLRRLTIQGQSPPFIGDLKDIQQLLGAAARPSRSFIDTVEELLLLLASRIGSFFETLKFDKETDYPLLFLRDAGEMNGFIVTAIEMGLLKAEGNQIRISPTGWKRVDELKKHQPKSKQAFVAMWFDPKLDDAWKNGLQPGIESSGYYKAFRIDRKEHNEKIDDQIIAEIRQSGLIVADFTGDRGGVYFEAGYAKGLGLPVIWTCRKDWLDRLHFDTEHYNHIVWSTPDELKTKLNNRIAATVLPPQNLRE